MKSNIILSIPSFIIITSTIINNVVNPFQIILPKRIIHTTTTTSNKQNNNNNDNANNNNKECNKSKLKGWTQSSESGEWEWEEDNDSTFKDNSKSIVDTFVKEKILSSATPKLPSGTFKPKQSLGQNFLKDGNTVGRIVSAFEKDVKVSLSKNKNNDDVDNNDEHTNNIIELGPGAGALTRPLYELYKSSLTCVELDPRSIEMLSNTYPELNLIHKDVLQLDYTTLLTNNNDNNNKQPLSIIGNLPYYITSQILFALADATHNGAVLSATVTMQWEVAQRIIASTRTKDYGILSIAFQLYSNPYIHFKIPPTVFYPKPKVDSALIGLQFVSPKVLRLRLAGVQPLHLRTVLSTVFQQRRKTLRNSVKKLLLSIHNGDKEKVNLILSTPPTTLPKYFEQEYNENHTGKDSAFSPNQRALPHDWSSKRPEELHPGQFIELTRLIYGPTDIVDYDSIYGIELPDKVWRKSKHGNG